MAQAILLPKLGQTVEEASIVKWHVKEGDAVKKGDILFEIETDKAVLEVESFYDGTILKVLIKENVMVPVSSTVAFIGEKGEKVPDAAPASPAAKPPGDKPAAPVAEKKTDAPAPERKAPPPATAPAAPAPQVSALSPQPSQAPQRLLISPRAKALAKKSVIDPTPIQGSGPNGRIVVKDVKAYLEQYGYDQIRISPAARKLASREDIDILRVKGTGTSGRIMVRDVETAIAEKPKTMTKMRQVIAKRLTESFMTIPHFYVTTSVDMTDLLAFRQELKKQEVNLSVTAFVLEAVILSLKELPVVNSITDGTTAKWHSAVDLGMAVGLEEGLVVPVMKNAEELSMQEIHDLSKKLATKARDGKLLPDEMTGSTFTVSNMGMLNVEQFNAIINPGESAILAVASTYKVPVVKDDRIVVRDIMKMTLSVDHRIVDGTMGAAFINAVKDKLEDVELWKILT